MTIMDFGLTQKNKQKLYWLSTDYSRTICIQSRLKFLGTFIPCYNIVHMKNCQSNRQQSWFGLVSTQLLCSDFCENYFGACKADESKWWGWKQSDDNMSISF